MSSLGVELLIVYYHANYGRGYLINCAYVKLAT